jgi:hypothetical protein
VDFGRKVSCTVSRNGDLIHKVYLQVDLPAMSGTNVRWVDNVGHVMIDEVSIEIGGQTIDKHYGDWMNIWNELTQTAEQADGYDSMVGGPNSPLTTAGSSVEAATLYVPLQFWFCRNAGLALPLIALQYHEVKFNITFRPAADCYMGTPSATPEISNASLYVDYIYLDTDERRQFAQVQHEIHVLESKYEKYLLVNVY